MEDEITQGEETVFSLLHNVDKSPVTNITAAKYGILNNRRQPLLEKTLGNGIAFVGGRIIITLTEAETLALPAGIYPHECVVKDQSGKTTYPITNESVNVKRTDLRLP